MADDESVAALQKQRTALEKQIAEARRRLPPHSVKPAEMMELLSLEDAHDALLKKIAQRKNAAKFSCLNFHAGRG